MKLKRKQRRRPSLRPDAELTNMVALAFRCRREAARLERAAAAQLAKKLGIHKKMGTAALELLQHAAQRRFGFGWNTWVANIGLDQATLIAAARCRKWIQKTSTAVILVIGVSIGCEIEQPAPGPALQRFCDPTDESTESKIHVEFRANCGNGDPL